MKKFILNIHEPCHENWDAMTQQEKGKFCGSCQKTVIDFTAMSDGHVAEFFKKPAGSVCGRFHQDQLQRPMEIPKKRIPWVKYFFQFTWPAFVLLLKSCGQKENIVGEITIESPKKENKELVEPTLGVVLTEIKSVDSVRLPQKIEMTETKNAIVGITNVEPPPPTLMGDTIAMPVKNIEVLKEDIKEAKAMDTVNIVSYPEIGCGRMMIAGAVSVVTTKETQKDIKVNDFINEANVSAYPNPARAGSQITIASASKSIIKQLQLLSSSGAMIKTLQANTLNYENAQFNIPATIAPGTYFLRIVLQDEKIKTAKIIITN